MNLGTILTGQYNVAFCDWSLPSYINLTSFTAPMYYCQHKSKNTKGNPCNQCIWESNTRDGSQGSFLALSHLDCDYTA